MKIAVNLLPFRKKLAGAGKYAQKIVWELSRIDSVNDYYLFITKEGKENFGIPASNFHFIDARFNPKFFLYRILWEQLIFPFKLMRLKPDAVFTPSVAIPLLYKGKFFTTVHDLAYKKSKHKYSLIRSIYISAVTKLAIRKSIIVFTVSNFSKKEIEDGFSVKDNKVIVTYNGVDEIFFKDYDPVQIKLFKKKYNLPENFILYVGAIEPGKNLDKLFTAFSESIKYYNSDLNLALTSSVGWRNEKLINMIYELKIQDKVIFLPYISEKDLPQLYKSSKMLVYLSAYEGFGIPVLEALASGTPVITSRSEAIMEFSNKAVVSINPEKIDEVVAGIIKILTDSEFVSAKVEAGKKEAAKFTWSDPANIIYEQISLLNKM